MSSLARTAILATVVVAVLSTAACSDPAAATGGAATTSTTPGTLSVVASTNVWGDIAATIGGDRVRVTSVISNPSADPHSYEASARTRLAVADAGLIIENGGGYDDFMSQLVAATRSTAPVIVAVDASGAAAAARSAGTQLNEHVWYDLPGVAKVADRITAALTAADPGGAATFRANAARFQAGLQALIAQETAARSAVQGAGVAITEPVPLYLLDAVGAVDMTPAAFSKAVEDGTDAPAQALQQTEALLTSGAVKALVYNEQTTGAQTELLLKLAQANHVAVVPVTETLPAGTSYLTWMGDNLAAVRTALA